MEFVCFICPLKVHSKVYAVLLSEIITILRGAEENMRRGTSNVSRYVSREEEECNKAVHVL